MVLPTREISSMVANVVFPVIHRCLLLAFHINPATLNQLLSLPPNSLRTLQAIMILIEDNPVQMADPISSATAFESCPQLRTFSLVGATNCYPGGLRIVNFNIPWHQLTTLHLFSPSTPAHECLYILYRCTSLQECNIFVTPINDLALNMILALSRHPVVLPFLHTLRIRFSGLEDDNCRYFFQALRLPYLRKFHPAGSIDPISWPLPVFQSVLCDTIQELDMSKFIFPENLPETLALVPNLEALWLGGGSHKYPRVMHAIGEGALCPRLTTLCFSFVESLNFLFDVLEARVAAARANPNITVFVNVRVRRQGNVPVDEARLRALTEAGLCISLLKLEA